MWGCGGSGYALPLKPDFHDHEPIHRLEKYDSFRGGGWAIKIGYGPILKAIEMINFIHQNPNISSFCEDCHSEYLQKLV